MARWLSCCLGTVWAVPFWCCCEESSCGCMSVPECSSVKRPPTESVMRQESVWHGSLKQQALRASPRLRNSSAWCFAEAQMRDWAPGNFLGEEESFFGWKSACQRACCWIFSGLSSNKHLDLCQEGHIPSLILIICDLRKYCRLTWMCPVFLEHCGQIQLSVPGKLSARCSWVSSLAFGQSSRRRQHQPWQRQQQQQDQSQHQGESVFLF